MNSANRRNLDWNTKRRGRVMEIKGVGEVALLPQHGWIWKWKRLQSSWVNVKYDFITKYQTI